MTKRILVYFIIIFFCYSSSSQIDQRQGDHGDLPQMSYEDAGFHMDSIQRLAQLIRNTPPNDFRGVVVLKEDHIVIEDYFHTFWRNTIHDVRSAGKSITALLIGVAIQEGLIENINQDVYSFFQEADYPFMRKDFQQIQLRHLLDMSSGLDADTNDPRSKGHVGHWINKDSWKSFLLQVPTIHKPGTKWVYADINAVLLGAVIEEVTGKSLKDYAREKLFDPLGIREFYWYANESNETGGAGNLYLTTLDFAKMGLLVLNKGMWNGSQIINPDFIDRIFERTFDISHDSPFADSYGTMWYKARRTFGGKSFEYIFASGNGGNHLVVIPAKSMVIALTSSAYGPGLGHRRSYNIMGKILESLK